MDALLSGSAASAISSPFTGANAVSQGFSPAAYARAGKSADAVAQDFESMFLSQMLQPMFSTVDVDDTFGGGRGEEVMRGFLLQEYGKAMAGQALGSGLHRAIRDDIIRRQGKAKDAKEEAAAPKTKHKMDILS
jgi:Rod binding domain-containing protein